MSQIERLGDLPTHHLANPVVGAGQTMLEAGALALANYAVDPTKPEDVAAMCSHLESVLDTLQN